MRRGSIWWASLGQPVRSGLGKRRPVVIVSSDELNASKITTVLAISVTTNLRLASAPGNVLLTVAESGLMQESVADVSQVITIDKSRRDEQVGYLPAAIVDRIDAGLRLVLGL